MSRRAALFVGGLWLAILAGFDLTVVFSERSLRLILDRFLADKFQVPPKYDGFTGGFWKDLVVRNLVIPRPDLEDEVLMSVGEVRIAIDWLSLVAGRPDVRLVTLRDPALRLSWDLSGLLDLPSPLKPAKGSEVPKRLPELRIEGLTLHLVNSPFLARPDLSVPIDNLELNLVPTPGKDWRYEFLGRIKDRALGEIDAFGHIGARDFGLKIGREGFHLSEGLKNYLLPDVADLLSKVGLTGDLDLKGSLDPDSEHGGAAFAARAELKGVAVKIDGWPQDLRELRGVIRYQKGRLSTEGPMTGTFEGAALTLTGDADFTLLPPIVNVTGEVRGLDLNDAFVDRIAKLPEPGPEVCSQLHQWAVRGLCNVDFRFGPDPTVGRESFSLRPDITVHLPGCEFMYVGTQDPATGNYDGFPYPLHDLRGTVHLTDERMQFVDLHARNGPVRLSASATIDYSKAGDEAFSAHIEATDVPADQVLFDALDPGTRAVVDGLRPQGRLRIQVIAERKTGGPKSVAPEVVIDLEGVRLHPTAFPYALENVCGNVVAKDDLIKLDSLSAVHGQSGLTLEGTVGIDSREGFLNLSVIAKHLAVDDELLVALETVAPVAGQDLRRLHAQGRFSLDLHVAKDPGAAPILHGDIELEGIALRPTEPRIAVDAIHATVALVETPLQRRLTIGPGATAAIAGRRFPVSGTFQRGQKSQVVVGPIDFTFDEQLLTALEGVLPVLADPSLRPEISGPAHGKVTIEDAGAGPVVRAKIEARGLVVRPPGWRHSRLHGVYGAIVAELGEVHLTDIVAVVERPRGLPALPPPLDPALTNPFQSKGGIEFTVRSCTLREHENGLRIALGDLHLSDVPLESWILDLLWLDDAQRERLRLPELSGLATVGIDSATITPGSVLVNGGALDLRSIHYGAEQLYLEKGNIEKFDVVVKSTGEVNFEGLFKGRNLRIFGVPVPRFEGKVAGNHESIGINEIGGVLFGFEQDKFDVKTASRSKLKNRAMDRGYVEGSSDLELMSDDALRSIIQSKEGIDFARGSREELVGWGVEIAGLSRDGARQMSSESLLDALNDARNQRPLGRIGSDGTRFRVAFETGEFDLRARLDDVLLEPTVKVLGGNPGDLRGRLRGDLSLAGMINDAESFRGDGSFQASAYNVIQLPVFLNILKALNPVSIFPQSSATDIDVGYKVSDRRIHLERVNVHAPGLELSLAEPSVITFGGIIHARFDASHRGGLSIPIISEIFGLLPSLLFDGVEVQGPLENPTVTARSMGFGDDMGEAPKGRKTVMKDPKK